MPVKDLVVRVFYGSLLILGSLMALNAAVCYLRSLLPWLIGAVSVAIGVWLIVAVVRWRRSKW